MRVVIVGASVAGIRTAQALRLQGFEGDVVIIGEEIHHPYDKPPLSKEHLAADGDSPVHLLSEEELAALDVELVLGVRATGLDPTARVVHTDAGDQTYDRLVIATGATPRTIPHDDLRGVHTIRTADDAATLRSRLDAAPQVVVIGAGFIGAEFAAAARARGCPVTILEAQQTPMAHILGDEVGGQLATLHERHGVVLRTGVRVAGLVGDGDGNVRGVELEGGEVVPAELVVVGIGARPATDWLEGSGLPATDGVECTADLQVVGFPEIHAAGDVARWPHALYGEPMRIEHWTNANEHAAHTAAVITGNAAPAAQVPYVWSDQYGHRIQIIGRPARGALAHLSGSAHDHLLAVYADESGRVVGGVVVDAPRAMMKVRRAITRGQGVDELDLPSATETAT